MLIVRPRARRAHTGGRSCPPHQGFTLIEVLVVIVLIGVILTFAVLSVGNPQRDILEREARRLAALMELAGEEAVLQSREIGVSVKFDGYTFLTLNGEKWSPIEGDELLRARETPEGIRLELEVEGRSVFEDDSKDKKENERSEPQTRPDVFLLSSGEISPGFEIAVRADTSDTYFRLTGEPTGALTLSGPED
jgi:general secretion pathway protein H